MDQNDSQAIDAMRIREQHRREHAARAAPYGEHLVATLIGAVQARNEIQYHEDLLRQAAMAALWDAFEAAVTQIIDARESDRSYDG